MSKSFNRAAEDVGNIIGVEHVNLYIKDQIKGTLFYITGLGFTRDPFMQVNVTNMWVNLGRSQFHLPTGKPQLLRGRIGLVVPSLDKLIARLKLVRKDLSDTKFKFSTKKKNKTVDIVCPWGNRFRAHESGAFGKMELGMPYVEFDVRTGTADGIVRFYREIMNAPGRVGKWDGGKAAIIQAGANQRLVFREKRGKEVPFDDHHIQIYVVDFSGPYKKLLERGLISQESNQYQYRFVRIVDPGSGEDLFEIDHEVRSMTHPLFGRPFANRNPDQTVREFAIGYEEQPWLQPAGS